MTPSRTDLWTCENCGFENLPYETSCFICYQSRPNGDEAGAGLASAGGNRRLFALGFVGLAATVMSLAGIAFALQNPAASGPEPSLESAVAVVAVERSVAPAPSDFPGTHTVRPGETLNSIASQLGVSETQLRWWNLDRFPSLRTNPRDLVVGWVLIAAGDPMPTPTPRPTPRPVSPPIAEGGSSAALVALPLLWVDVWNADEIYHAISGRNPIELVNSSNAAAPLLCGDHSGQATACAGPTQWDFEPAYYYDPGAGSCTLLGVEAHVVYAAYLPQWTSPAAVPPELLAWWQQVLEHIRWHEEQHIRIFADYVAQLPGLYSGQPCDAQQAIIDAWSADLQSAQDAFDAGEYNWQPPLYGGPWSW